MIKKLEIEMKNCVEKIENSKTVTQLSPYLKEFYTTLEKYQQDIIKTDPVSCKIECTACCYHWAEDIYSFELALISSELKDKFPLKIVQILKKCREDEEIFKSILEKLKGDELKGDESEEFILNLFYQKNRPCPLLIDKKCLVYEVRPLTCRSFFSRSNPKFCNPKHSFDKESHTVLISPPEELEDRLDEVHFKFDKFGITGLRSGLLRSLG